MTPARKRALQWFHDRGEGLGRDIDRSVISFAMQDRMYGDGQLTMRRDWPAPTTYTLTDKGRRVLHGDLE